MTSMRILFAASAGAVLLSACGGGGGDAGSPPPAAAVAITAANQQAVARVALDGGLALTRSQVLAADERTQSQSLQTDAAAQAALPTSARGAVLSLAQRAATYAFPEQRRVRADARVRRPMAIDTVTQDCSAGGSITLSIDDVDNSQSLNANDTLTMGFAQCKEAADESINGTIRFTVASASASGDQFSASIAFESVSMTFGQASTSVNGSASVNYLTTSTSVTLQLTIGSSGLSVALNAPQYSDTVAYESGLRIDSTEYLTSPAWSTASISGSFTSSAIGGRITLTTLQPVAQLHSDVYPYAGQIRVVGASSSALQITVLNATQVRIELDADGNGSYDAPVDLAWSSVLPE